MIISIRVGKILLYSLAITHEVEGPCILGKNPYSVGARPCVKKTRFLWKELCKLTGPSPHVLMLLSQILFSLLSKHAQALFALILKVWQAGFSRVPYGMSLKLASLILFPVLLHYCPLEGFTPWLGNPFGESCSAGPGSCTCSCSLMALLSLLHCLIAMSSMPSVTLHYINSNMVFAALAM